MLKKTDKSVYSPIQTGSPTRLARPKVAPQQVLKIGLPDKFSRGQTLLHKQLPVLQARRSHVEGPKSGPMPAVLHEAEQAIGLPGCSVALLDPRHARDMHGAARLLAEVFLTREPMAQALGRTVPNLDHVMTAFAADLTHAMAHIGLTAVARNAQGDVIGLVMAEPLTDAPPPNVPELQPVFAVLGALFEKFQAFAAQQPEQVGERVLHLAMAAAARHTGSNTISGALLKVVLSQAQLMGFTSAVAEATSKASQLGLTRQFQFAQIDAEAYAQHPAFAGIQKPPAAQLLFRSLTGIPTYLPDNLHPD